MPRQPKPTPANDRAAKVAALQRQAKVADRRRGSTIWLLLALVVALILGLVAWAVIDQNRNRPGMGDVQTYTGLGSDHINDQALTYDQAPPVGGDHNAAFWTCGIYTSQLPNHHVVHSLEHGAVWITYQPGLAQEQIDQLADLADQPYLILSPYEGQEFPVMVTAWGTQLGVESASDSRIEQFIRDYRQGPQTPELGASCDGGTTEDLVGG